MLCWNSYKASLSKGNVVEQEYIERIVAVTCFLGKQGIAFRGHDERDESHNRGNFLECMSLLTKFDHLQIHSPFKHHISLI